MEHINLIIDKKYFQNNNISSNSISIDSFTAKVGAKVLFEDSTLKLSKGIYGLIGPNGCGKSTLLLLMKYNRIPINTNWSKLYLEQEIEETNITPIEIIIKSNNKLDSLKKRRDILNKLLESNEELDDDLFDELNDLEQEIGIYNEEKELVKIKKILLGLGFTEEMQNKSSNTFSGGWKMRISLARSLYIQPDVLLMDEPTNHLDLEAIIWLTNYLENYNKNKIIVLVSHNIGFLNNVCDYIMNIENNKLHTYKGNYYRFKKQLLNKEQEIQKKWDKFQKKVKGMKKKGIKKKDIDILMKKDSIIKPDKRKVSKFEFYNHNTDGNNIITVNNLTFGYDNKLIFEKTDFGIRNDSKIILVGKNGCGKSTLLKIMSGSIYHENVFIKSGIKIGVYDQHFELSLPLDKSPVEYLADFVPDDISGDPKFVSRAFLGKVKLEPQAHLEKIKHLSGGQKARVALVKLIFSRPHLLILDEPTNHLDIETVECLIDALDNFTGAFMVITHERHLIEKLEDDIELFLIENKKIIKYKKEFNEYCNRIISQNI